MLTRNRERGFASGAVRSRLAKARSIKWLGQTTASGCWIGSMLTSGIESTGDWLQLCAASAWLLANIATLLTTDAD
jgi:hydroxyethylthiazole kinase-like sugar kinase family protein